MPAATALSAALCTATFAALTVGGGAGSSWVLAILWEWLGLHKPFKRKGKLNICARVACSIYLEAVVSGAKTELYRLPGAVAAVLFPGAPFWWDVVIGVWYSSASAMVMAGSWGAYRRGRPIVDIVGNISGGMVMMVMVYSDLYRTLGAGSAPCVETLFVVALLPIPATVAATAFAWRDWPRHAAACAAAVAARRRGGHRGSKVKGGAKMWEMNMKEMALKVQEERWVVKIAGKGVLTKEEVAKLKPLLVNAAKARGIDSSQAEGKLRKDLTDDRRIAVHALSVASISDRRTDDYWEFKEDPATADAVRVLEALFGGYAHMYLRMIGAGRSFSELRGELECAPGWAVMEMHIERVLCYTIHRRAVRAMDGHTVRACVALMLPHYISAEYLKVNMMRQIKHQQHLHARLHPVFSDILFANDVYIGGMELLWAKGDKVEAYD
eukprot:gene18365-42346_t